MPEEIFDQDRPRSTMAQHLDEAFAGCDEWTLAPPSPRRSDSLDVVPWLSKQHSRVGRFSAEEPESRAA